MTKQVLLIYISSLICSVCFAGVPVPIDTVLAENLRSVRFYPAGDPLGLPIVILNQESFLHLEFDKMGTEFGDYYCSIMHCNADWSPSDQISEMEYSNGINKALIRNFEQSFTTLVNYTHYNIDLPNDELSWVFSGNYLLKVYDRENDDKLVFIRRFIVSESLTQVNIVNTRPAEASKSRTHEEFDFNVNYKNFPIRNPRVELQAMAMMNGRWDNAKYGLRPVFVRGDDMSFDYQDVLAYPGGKEFRFFDLRSLRFELENVINLRRIDEGVEVTLRPDVIDTYTPYLFRVDLNGNYVIQCRDETMEDCATRGDYGFVNFTLKSNEAFEGQDVYVTGAFCDWQLKEENKMAYSEDRNAYTTEILLKQGYYNYQYTLYNPKTHVRDDTQLEGNWSETENKFTVVVYYRAFGDRYDRAIGRATKDSRTF